MSWQPRGSSEIPMSPFSMPQALWQALHARGFETKEALDELFSPSLQSLKDPFTLKNMDKACERLVRAFDNNEKVVIYADFDLDGSSGLALLYEGMNGLGFKNLDYYQPKRLSEGYGLHSHAIEDLAKDGAKVIVTVDVGITAIDAAVKAKEVDIDLIITDHHLPYEKLPDAYAIVNPNQKECTSGLGYLCGAGVAFFLLMALKKSLQNKLTGDFNLKDVLDFFVVGTLTDLVPLIKDNRVLVKHGLLKLSQTQRPALRFLMDSLGLKDRQLTSQEVAINLAPKLNALSRMEAQYLPRDVFLETDASQAETIVDHVLRTQEMRKAYQKNAMAKAVDLKLEMDQTGYIWIWSHDFHKGVIGLVATSLSETFRVPVFVGSVNTSSEVAGSARLPEGSDIDLTKVLEGGQAHLAKYGGHAQAAGFSLPLENALALDAYFKDYFEKAIVEQKAKTFIYDALVSFQDLTASFMKWLEALEPFGKDFPSLQFLFEKVKVTKLRELKGGHLKMTLLQGANTVETVIFSPSEKYKVIRVGTVMDVLGEPKWNYFNGSKTLQIFIKDFRI